MREPEALVAVYLRRKTWESVLDSMGDTELDEPHRSAIRQHMINHDLGPVKVTAEAIDNKLNKCAYCGQHGSGSLCGCRL